MKYTKRFRPTADDLAAIEKALDLIHRRREIEIEEVKGIIVEPTEFRRATKGRRLRDQFFGAGLFEEPGWDMMLALFVAELEGTKVSVSSLCIAAAVAPTTALRWINKLIAAGLFERTDDPFDRRVHNMTLSEHGSLTVQRYIAAMRREGISLS